MFPFCHLFVEMRATHDKFFDCASDCTASGSDGKLSLFFLYVNKQRLHSRRFSLSELAGQMEHFITCFHLVTSPRRLKNGGPVKISVDNDWRSLLSITLNRSSG